MPVEKKVHYWKDCSVYGDRNTSRVALSVEEVTCGACKQNILKVLLTADWSKLPPGWAHALRTAALFAYGVRDQLGPLPGVCC